MSQVNQAV